MEFSFSSGIYHYTQLFSILFFHLLRAVAKPGEPVNGQDERRFQRRR
jgi:hypothetical protein